VASCQNMILTEINALSPSPVVRPAWSTSTQTIVTTYLSYKLSAEIESTSAKHDYDEGMLCTESGNDWS